MLDRRSAGCPLFRDPSVRFRRVNRRGDAYSIAEDAASEFLRWEDMPWE
jgi:hypothetical protein